MTRLLHTLTALLFAFAVLATTPAAAQTCSALPTCFKLPKYSYPQPSWTYSHQCCENQNTVWNVYVDSLGRWRLVSSNILP
jgi:hypothetical protein